MGILSVLDFFQQFMGSFRVGIIALLDGQLIGRCRQFIPIEIKLEAFTIFRKWQDYKNRIPLRIIEIPLDHSTNHVEMKFSVNQKKNIFHKGIC